MLYVLYRAGKGLQKNDCKILSRPGITALLIYTLNEGLRFGRGIDYNYYWNAYETLTTGKEYETNIGFLYFIKALVFLEIPWQGCVMLISFVYIFAVLFLMKSFKEVLPFALPLFVLFSIDEVNNMIRWFFAFSFVLIGISYQLRENRKLNAKFVLLSFVACTIHYAIIPIPIMFYLLTLIKKPLLHPFVSISLFYAIAFLFDTSFMMQFVDLFNFLAMTSEKFETYSNNPEFWLTGGYDGVATSPFPGISEQVFLLIVVWFGYNKSLYEDKSKVFVYAYNLFIIGLLIYPIAKQVELILRYHLTFFFFRGIVVAYIIWMLFYVRNVKVVPLIKFLVLLSFVNIGRQVLYHPFTQIQDRYLYVWDKKRQTPESMLQMWNDTRYNNSKVNEKRNE